jgi:S1-C subfamily serine protease
MLRVIFALFGCLAVSLALAQSPRRVVDDDEYLDRVIGGGLKLMEAGKLRPQATLSSQVNSRVFQLKMAPVSHRRLEPPELFEHLRQSTLAIGTLYKCRECKEWHFNSSAGFVVGDGGVVSTCCHVVVGIDEVATNGFLLAADADGHTYPVQAVLAADTEADTCLLKIEARGLKPLAIRTGARTGERVFCLSHPGGYYFMFTQGMVARVNRRANEEVFAGNSGTPNLTRPILFLNVTAEFAPGSSGAAIVDESGNVVGQVASITDAGDPSPGDDHNPPSPSVPVRFCTASEEIIRLTVSGPGGQVSHHGLSGTPAKSSPHSRSSAKPQSPALPPWHRSW